MTATAQKQRTAKFNAAGEGLTIEMETPQEVRDHRGDMAHVPGTGKWIEFVKLVDGSQVYETADPAEIEFLRSHEGFGRFFFEIPEIKSPSGPALAEIADCAASGDSERIAAIYEAEEEGEQRSDVLETALRTLKTLEGRKG